jgi:threonine/homoserine/homoserine lactone efflux protein
MVNKANKKECMLASFIAGFILTLGDVKAVIFYVSLFPVFIDLSALKATEILVVIFVTVLGVGGVKILYALSATKVASIAGELKFEKAARKTAGGFMVGAGTYLIVKA